LGLLPRFIDHQGKKSAKQKSSEGTEKLCTKGEAIRAEEAVSFRHRVFLEQMIPRRDEYVKKFASM